MVANKYVYSVYQVRYKACIMCLYGNCNEIGSVTLGTYRSPFHHRGEEFATVAEREADPPADRV